MAVLLTFIGIVCYVVISPEDFFWFAIVLFLGVICAVVLLVTYLKESSELEAGMIYVQNYGSINPRRSDPPPNYSSVIMDTGAPSVDALAALETEYKEKFRDCSEEELPTYESAMCSGQVPSKI
ncbi:hypothetical protein SK128_007691 [Halocaridina rubra]|uniref:Uncharacterized protein n=1 Tax=Halocaridina rubra TaxID=373956 RepID=A0AAN8XB61_HALRR